jgi:hypothetical protein
MKKIYYIDNAINILDKSCITLHHIFDNGYNNQIREGFEINNNSISIKEHVTNYTDIIACSEVFRSKIFNRKSRLTKNK